MEKQIYINSMLCGIYTLLGLILLVENIEVLIYIFFKSSSR